MANVLVVDASALAPAVAGGGADGEMMRRRLRSEVVAAPDLLRLEVASVIRRQLTVGKLTVTQAERALDDLLEFPLQVYPTAPLLRRAWELRNNVSPYDACYVALAETLGSPLVTADQRLANAPGLTCRVELVT